MDKYDENKVLRAIAEETEERCKWDPDFRAMIEASRLRRKCAKTHKKWLEDRDVHGHLGWYCADCGVWKEAYSFDANQRESYMKCSEIKQRG